MQVEVVVTLKEGVLDPQGKAIHHALAALGFQDVESVKVGKMIVLEIKQNDKEKVKTEVEAMCNTLLANAVIENYTIKL